MANFAEITEETLRSLYETRTTYEIGEKYGVTPETVRKRLAAFGIARRKTGPVRSFEPTPAALNKMYQSLSMAQIAEKFGVGETVVWKRLKEYGIILEGFEDGGHRKKTGKKFSDQHKLNLSRSNRGKFGPLNKNWRGGRTEEMRRLRGSASYFEWKARALELRGYKCQECGIKQGFECNHCGFRMMLHVHHVESFARVPSRRFDPTNSEILCHRCHHRRHRSKSGELRENPSGQS